MPEPMTSPVPGFFIVGAPKTGTSAMWRYLMDHPDVFMSAKKEPHYYATDIVDPIVRDPSLGIDWYLSLFRDAGDAKVVGEASIFYLFSKAAIPALRDAYPDAKILVMVRNPVDLIHSFHSQLLYSGQETEKSFERAWALCRQGPRAGSPRTACLPTAAYNAPPREQRW